MGQVLRTLLRQVIEERGFSLADVSRRIGKSRSFLPKALDPENTTSLRADQVPQILATIGMPKGSFYRRYLKALGEMDVLVDEAEPHEVLTALTSLGSPTWACQLPLAAIAGEKLVVALTDPRPEEIRQLSRTFADLVGRS